MVVVVGAPSAERRSTTSACRAAGFEVCELDYRRDVRTLSLEHVGCVVFDPVAGNSAALVEEVEGGWTAPPLVLICGRQRSAVAVRSLGPASAHRGARAFDLALVEQVGAALRDASARRAERCLRGWFRERLSGLSERRRRILALIVAGRSSAEIARELGIERPAVDRHLGHIMRALGLGTAAGLLRAVLDTADPAAPAAGRD